MDFIKLLGTVFAVCYHSGSASKVFSGQRICRRGTERPCYKIAYFQDYRLRVSFELAQQTCRDDDGELLSLETQNEQHLVERFIQQLRATDGDFWIGLGRTQRFSRPDSGSDCPSQYSWLDHSQATFRNWQKNEPSCGHALCVALYHRPSSLHGQRGQSFKWHDDICSTKNNFICKYSEEKPFVPTRARNATTFTDAPVSSMMPKYPSFTKDYEKIKTGISESSVSVSDDGMNVYYILLATIPILLLLLLMASGVLCFRVLSKRRKEQNESEYAQPTSSASTAFSSSPSSRFSTHIYTQPGADLHYMCPDIKGASFAVSSPDSQFNDYENVTGAKDTESGFVTNDIYESCPSNGNAETGWVENEIYGY